MMRVRLRRREACLKQIEAAPALGRERVLSPVERLSEILFGLIMAVSIVGSLSVATASRVEIRELLVAAIGCNTAWGLVDALMYLLTVLVERRRGRVLLAALRREEDEDRARRAIADQLPPLLAAAIRPSEIEHVRGLLVGMQELPRAGLTRRDLAGAIGVFLLVFLSTVPVVVPFLLPIEPHAALRLSNGIALALLFAVGCRLGQYVSGRPLVFGAAMTALGAALVAAVMALGG
jgi:VIT1/CCC1 family predicted Fe2+/Mn2+ transporter